MKGTQDRRGAAPRVGSPSGVHWTTRCAAATAVTVFDVFTISEGMLDAAVCEESVGGEDVIHMVLGIML